MTFTNMSYEPQSLRQRPACENHRDQHKTGKRKVWRFGSEWLPEKRFIEETLVNGEWIKHSLTLQEMIDRGDLYFVNESPPVPCQKFKTREDALKSWESMKAKKLIGRRGCKYWLENTATKEIVDL